MMNATDRLDGLNTRDFSEVSGNEMNQIEGGDGPDVTVLGAAKRGAEILGNTVNGILEALTKARLF